MATSVYAAFSTFIKQFVRLDPNRTTVARSSRDELIKQIERVASNNTDFPSLYSAKHIAYGSFARRTKIRPLDDIDLMIALSANGATYSTGLLGEIQISVPATVRSLRLLCNENTDVLNSRKVINAFIGGLKDVHLYRKADLKRNQEAAVLVLSTYEWHYDIVPCFVTNVDENGRSYYIIPDGSGNWKITDPRIDRKRVADVNQKHEGHVLDVIRTLKYWQSRPIMPTMSSYLLETLILYYYEAETNVASEYVDKELSDVFNYIAGSIRGSVADPKGIQGNINTLSWDERIKIATVARDHANKAVTARAYETAKDHKNSIRLWTEIFGSDFPPYTTS